MRLRPSRAGTVIAAGDRMVAFRFALMSIVFAACATDVYAPYTGKYAELYTPPPPPAVGPSLGESTAMGPADSTRPLAPRVPGGVPTDVGPGVRITGAGPGAPAPSEPVAVAEQQPVIILPIEEPPPVFQPPPPPPPPDLSDRVFSEDEG